MAKTLKITTDDRIKVVDVDFNQMEDIQRDWRLWGAGMHPEAPGLFRPRSHDDCG